MANPKVESIHDATRLTDSQVELRKRAEVLKQLQDGWLNGSGVAPSHTGIDWLIETFEVHFPHDLPLPFLFSTPEGNGLTEWQLTPWAVSLDIDLQSRQADWHALNLDTDAEDEESYDLTESDAWQDFSAKLRGYLGEST